MKKINKLAKNSTIFYFSAPQTPLFLFFIGDMGYVQQQSLLEKGSNPPPLNYELIFITYQPIL